MNDLPYVGQELDIFAHAMNWKRYWSRSISQFLSGDVLEVGAGIGANTPLLSPASVRSWVCLEPDEKLARRAAAALASAPATSGCQIVVGTTQTLQEDLRFDTLLYIDVLEHIQHDGEELERAAMLLKKGGRLIVLSPAHQSLYTEFDRSIGHFRRYDRAGLIASGPKACALSKLWYLDSVGMLASCANRLLLRQAMPRLRQILFWDRYMVPASTVMDRLLFHQVGKSILAVWTKV
jgi:ubiquinone/menaquinone biosynthesis C-methylase UbiE